MRLRDYAFRPGWLPTLATLALLVLFISLGNWQLQRAAYKDAVASAMARGMADQPLDLGQAALPPTPSERYRRATVSGRYLDRQHWLLDNRLFQGAPGYHVYSLFQPGTGAAPLLVNRGWVSAGPDRAFLPEVQVPPGELTLRGRLDLPASVGIELGDAGLDSPAAVVRTPYLRIEPLAVALGQRLQPFALVLDSGQPGAFQYDWIAPRPMSADKHRGYAVQWFAMAIALLIIYVGVNLRRARQHRGTAPADGSDGR